MSSTQSGNPSSNVECFGKEVKVNNEPRDPEASEVKLRVKQDDCRLVVEARAKQPTLENTEIGNQPESAFASVEAAAPSSESRDDLMNIITDPNSPEEKWLSACNSLANNSQIPDKRSTPRRKRSYHVAMLSISAVILCAVIGILAATHWGSSARPQVDYHQYIVAMQREIRSHWRPPANTQSSRVTIHLKLLRSGDITDVGFDRMSRLSEVDAAALKSVVESIPALPPLPKASPESVDVQFHFDYNVAKKN